MMRRVHAVALLCLRSALRSRIVLSLLLLLLIVLGGLPAIVRGDGTPAGEWRVLVAYPLTAALLVLGLASLWAGCAVFAGEIETGRLQLTRLRPIRPLELWLGHGLGLLTLNALLLGLVWLALSIWIPYRLGPEHRNHESLQQPFRTITPDWGDPGETALRLIEHWRASGRLPSDLPAADLRREALRQVHAHQPLEPGETIVFPFALDQPLKSDRSWIDVRIDLDAGTPLRRELSGRLTLRDPDSGRQIETQLETRAASRHGVFRFDATTLHGARRLVVALQAAEAPNRAAVLVGREAVTLRLPHGHHATNALRAALGLLGILFLLAAVGLACGAVFSFPVAAFCATTMIVVVLLSHFVASQGFWWESEAPTPIVRLSNSMVKTVARLTTPITADAPIRHLAETEWIAPQPLLRATALRGLLYPLLLGMGATLALKRREVGR